MLPLAHGWQVWHYFGGALNMGFNLAKAQPVSMVFRFYVYFYGQLEQLVRLFQVQTVFLIKKIK